MCTRVLLGKGSCPIGSSHVMANPRFSAEHSKLLIGEKALDEVPEVIRSFENCFKCPHFDIAQPQERRAS